MAKFRPVLIRALAVVIVAFVVRVLATSFSIGDLPALLLDVGLPVLLGLLAFAAIGPKSTKAIHKALYPTLYALVFHFIWVNVAGSSEDGSFSNFWAEGIQIRAGFILAVPTLYLINLVWKPKPKPEAKQEPKQDSPRD